MRFDRFVLDLAAGCLRAGEDEIALRPKPFEVLCYMAQNAGRLVTKQELLDAVWPDVTVSDESIAQSIWELRQKLGDRDHSLIKTVARRGYLLNAVVSLQAPQPRPNDAAAQKPPEAEPSNAEPGVQQSQPPGPTMMWPGVLRTQVSRLQRLASTPGKNMLLLLGVAALLAAAWLAWSHEAAAARRRQAVVDIFVKTMGSPIFGPAYSALYDGEPAKVLAMPVAEFDKRIAQLSDIYWAVGVCVSAGQCDERLARKVFCFDFKTYEFAYNVTHPPGQRWQGFGDETLSVFCGCEGKHRFSAMKDRPLPAPWEGCGRKVN